MGQVQGSTGADADKSDYCLNIQVLWTSNHRIPWSIAALPLVNERILVFATFYDLRLKHCHLGSRMGQPKLCFFSSELSCDSLNVPQRAGPIRGQPGTANDLDTRV